MKLTTDYDRDQQKAIRRRNRLISQELVDKCPCEFLAERILVHNESPAQIHRWALHSQPPKFLKQLITVLSPPPSLLPSSLSHPHSPFGAVQFSHSATQLWPQNSTGPGDFPPNAAAGAVQFGQYSFDSLERSKPGKGAQGCEHRLLFLAILSTERAIGSGYFTLLQSWGIPLANLHDFRGQGPLHWAVERQALNCVQELVQLMGPKVKEAIMREDSKGISPIHLAAAIGGPNRTGGRILKLLLDQLDAKELQLESLLIDNEGMSPLHHAAAAGNEQNCELLLGPAWRMPLDLRDNLGRTPLHLAAWTRGGANVVRLLMAKKSIAATARDNRGWTPLHIAIMANNRPVLEALLDGMGQSGAQIFDHDSRTPLHYAALYDRADLAALLIGQTGANNATRDRFNVTPAHYAAQSASFQTLQAILGEDGQGQQPVDSEGRTPFMWAIIGQNEGMARAMLANKMHASRLLTAKDRFKQNCLHLAALSGGLEICKLLVEESNSALNVEPDEDGATPEHLAAGHGNSELILWFGFQRGHLAPPLDVIDRTPFFHACLGGQVSTVEAMLRSLHINPSHVDNLGRSAIHWAVISGSLNCLKVLVESKMKFDLELMDNNNKSALELAKEEQYPEIVHYLESIINQKMHN